MRGKSLHFPVGDYHCLSQWFVRLTRDSHEEIGANYHGCLLELYFCCSMETQFDRPLTSVGECMADILIAEDSATQAAQIRALLESQGYQTRVVADGAEALAAVGIEPPLAVLTDLEMPRMNGLELVTALRREHPRVPVILMTAFGSEAIAIQALQSGAASYVPKKNLKQDLLGTVKEVLEVAQAQQDDARVCDCLAEVEAEFELPNLSAPVMPIVGYLQETMSGLRVGDESDRLRLGVALDAAIQNAIYYGNLEFTVEELQQATGLDDSNRSFQRLLHERSLQSPFCDRKVIVRLTISRAEVSCEVAHEGPGFDRSLTENNDLALSLAADHPPAWLLVKSFNGKITFHPGGNQVTLSKRYSP